MKNLIAQNPFGSITLPATVQSKYGTGADPGHAFGIIIQDVIWLLIIGAGIYSLFNIIFAGYEFLSAGDDSKKVAGAWAKIWQTMLGLAVAAGSFVLAAIFGKLIFNDWTFILNPTIPNL